MVSSGTCFSAMAGSAALILCSSCCACSVSSEGKCVAVSVGSSSVTDRAAGSVVVANDTSTVPSIGVLAPFGVIAIAARAVRVLCSGQEIACGW